MVTNHVHISRGISKLGVAIPSVNLPPVITCRKDAPCREKCYARKGRFAFSHNKDLARQNLRIWEEDPEFFEREIVIAAYCSRFFRWHSSGDIPDRGYLQMMVNVANKCPGTEFLCFTKKYEMINEYMTERGKFPDNLRIVMSAWGKFMPSNPNNLPVAYVRFKKCEWEQTEIPDDAIKCSGYCGTCAMGGASCWELKNGQTVCFNEH